MARDFFDDDEVEESIASHQSTGGSGTLKIPEGKTPVYFLQSAYADGYVHWVTLPDGSQKRVVDCSGLEGKGWDPDTNPITSYAAELYKKARKLEDSGNKEGADGLRKRAGKIKPKYEARFLVAKGEFIKEKNSKGKKVAVPDFDEAEVGVLTMTRTQFDNFSALRKSETFDFIKGPKDLMNRVIVLDKRKRDGSTMATTEFTPSKRISDPPDVEYDEDDFDLDASYETDEKEVHKIAKLLRGGTEMDDDEDEVDFDEDDIDEDFLEEDDEEEAPKKKKKSTTKKSSSKSKAKKKVEEEEEDDEEDDDTEEEDDEDDADDFEDDLFDDDDEPPKKKSKKKK